MLALSPPRSNRNLRLKKKPRMRKPLRPNRLIKQESLSRKKPRKPAQPELLAEPVAKAPHFFVRGPPPSPFALPHSGSTFSHPPSGPGEPRAKTFKVCYSLCAFVARCRCAGEGVRLKCCSILDRMDGRMMTPDEVSSGSLPPRQRPRKIWVTAALVVRSRTPKNRRGLMKIVIVSDIHANLAALRALPERDYDQLWCIGDLVDYGPRPHEVVQWMRGHATVAVRGNHDHAAGFSVDPQCSPG